MTYTSYKIHKDCIDRRSVDRLPELFRQLNDKSKCWIVDTIPDDSGYYIIRCK
jgi:hypothetical protein